MELETPAVDYNRGVTIRMHPRGFDVNMYKDTPGVFYGSNGKAISEQIALEAGFNIKHLLSLKEKQDKLVAVQKAIEEEYGSPIDEILATAGGYSAVSIGKGLYTITDEDGNSLATEPMNRESAIALIDSLAPSSVKEEVLVEVVPVVEEKVKTKKNKEDKKSK